MALIDHCDVFIGSTGDGWTFVVLNRPIPHAARILTEAGFTAREHQGRTLYLLPPKTAQDAHERAGVATYGLLAHTLDLADLAWTTRHHGTSAAPQPDVSIRFTDPRGHRDRGHGPGRRHPRPARLHAHGSEAAVRAATWTR
ncbi:hypothetical protein ABZ078_26590 [Streptomyces sp. NPDC006385]|uniref:hypothetical protein n=1 Tax=Streptomyces sp. NPDC006385 TaxID=3156761 RepID=UPI0033AEE3CC